MGGIKKEATIQGRNLKEAFKALQDEDRYEYGSDVYSGGWNNCAGIREVSRKVFNEKEHNLSKHEGAIAVCVKKPVTNQNKIKTVVESFPQKGARKWVTEYIATNYCGNVVAKELTQTKAIEKARKYVENYPNDSVEIHIAKTLKGSKSLTTKITYKKSGKESDGVWEIVGIMPY